MRRAVAVEEKDEFETPQVAVLRDQRITDFEKTVGCGFRRGRVRKLPAKRGDLFLYEVVESLVERRHARIVAAGKLRDLRGDGEYGILIRLDVRLRYQRHLLAQARGRCCGWRLCGWDKGRCGITIGKRRVAGEQEQDDNTYDREG